MTATDNKTLYNKKKSLKLLAGFHWRQFGYFIHTRIYTYHLRFIPEGVAEASQILLRDAHVLLIFFVIFVVHKFIL
jgi:hypothetical protein